MLKKKFWWLSLLLAGLLAMGFLVGCEETDDDDDDDSSTTNPVPEAFRGHWETVGVQIEGSDEIYLNGGINWLLISSNGTQANFYNDFTEVLSGQAVWQDGTTDHLIITDSAREIVIDMEVKNVDGNWATFVIPFTDGGDVSHDSYHMIKDGGRIAGVVYDTETSTPLENATVTLTNSSDNNIFGTTQTNEFGLYEFTGVTEMYYQVEAALSGYQTETMTVQGDEDDLRFQYVGLSEGDPTGTVSGLINDSVTGVEPEVEVTVTLDGEFQLTSTDGTYIIRDVSLGTHLLGASANGYQFFTQSINVEEGVNVHNINLIPGEVGEGIITGVITDSQEGNPLQGVLLTSDDDVTAYTDAAGAYTMTVGAGVRTVTLSLDGYYNTNFTIAVEDEDSHTQNMVMTPLLSGGELRFVLTWGVSPSDLDSYLETPEIEGTEYTISYRDHGSAESAPYATLDLDDMSSYGPETITIFQQQPGTYKYMVHNYSGSPDIAGSGATVQIYNDTGLINTVVVPTEGTGYWWYVCDVDGSTGNIALVNTVGDRPEFIPDELPAKISE